MEEFELFLKDYFDQFIPPMNKVLSDSKKKEKYINEIILIMCPNKLQYITYRIIY